MRFSRSSVAAAALAASLPLALAQTSTTCDPTKKTCSADTGLNAATFSSDFTTGSNASWSAATGTTITYGSDGAEFIISEAGQAPTIQFDKYIFFGRVEVKMKAATGTGIVSSIVLESDDLDEIDWEFLGGDTTEVETNFFGKGNTTAYDRAIYYPVSTPQASFHTYTIDWTSERIEFIIDGVTVRTLAYTDSLTVGGTNYPQTPMILKLGNWCGGCSGEAEGTIEWAGGNTTFDNAPYTMVVSSVKIENYNPADSYVYGDMTGSYESIEIVNGTSSASNTSATSTVSSGSSTATSAATSSVTVIGVDQQTVAAVSTTVTGSSYSMNTASASAQNANSTAISATTQVPGSSPTASSSSTAQSSDASANTITAAAMLLSVALAFFML